ncbi:ATPase family protein associated with various cellular activities (AAA) [Advenella incenata]|uniref:ATPase family protein associated with various cellular activities (AAA) n=1 Tax=Advenella incenata TaxID=267800 RepID=A0A4Q7VPH6_9BURK|nr:ATP-binding protein [Advenella incenata]RZT98269.1 ATPase family protein associated with various cellular activities (AAA) [Advenella incenata]
MAKDFWLPRGHGLPDGSKIRSLLYFGEEWQILDTTGPSNILIARQELVQNWNEIGLLAESVFVKVSTDCGLLYCLSSPKKYVLAPVVNGKSPENKLEVLAFALAIKESRKFSDSISFHNAVYVEQYSRLLPTSTLIPHVIDEVVLGTWMSGGVAISTASFRRLAALTGWMHASELADILNTVGFYVPTEVRLFTKPQHTSKVKIETKPNISLGSDESSLLTQSSDTSDNTKVFKLPGRPLLECFFNEHVIDIIFNVDKYQAMGIEFPSAVVLHGPPGCGKTFAVERLVEHIDWPCYPITSNSVGSPYVHATSKKISEIFDKAIDTAPSVIVIDEMESFLSDRNAGISSGLHHVEEVAEFLRRIPEAINSNVLIIAMTNLIDMIDPAILRRGRFDHIIEVGMPSREEVESLIESLLSKLPVTDELNIARMLDVLAGKALSDVTFVIREAARLAAKNGKTQLDQECIDAAVNGLPNSQDKKGKSIGFIWSD